MPFIASADAPSYSMHGASFTGLASPSRGATENSVWIVTLHFGANAVTHRLSREETFVCIEGRALAQVGDETFEVTEGSALVVPANTDFKLSNPDATPFRAVAVLPVGGQAMIGDGAPFTPPWAQ
ncbi:cupin domain-containing protein [Paraburkholderia sp. D15]|uniref:cupin domain-containing protein n=1 Tax=Paraburkholderia sp. D15 TaxID=2880218 RepID=UPI0024787DCD|nr:cupin domain-containing protein [Paraburkholderia sp. D15]WGS53884.1 cupin domain-containing protein [Paraburkholderia sp. D15]